MNTTANGEAGASDCPADRHPPDGGPDTLALTFEAVRARQVRVVATAFLQRRAAIVAAGMVAVIMLLAASPTPRLQVLLLGCGFGVLGSFFLAEAWRGRRGLFSERWFFASLLVTVGGLTLGCLVTGGLGSPLLAVYAAPVVTVFAAFGKGRQAVRAAAACAAGLGLLAIVHGRTPFELIPDPWRAWIAGLALVMALALLWASVTSLTSAYRAVGVVLDGLRADVFAEAADRLRSLESVGAQVAHEIKNPLAAIKTLLQLEAEQARDARAAKRFAVMLEEVERIHRVTLDYLSYARPLTELALRPVAAREVLEALELLLGPEAARRGVALRVEATAATLVCDPRRLREAVLNLALNALEHTAAGGNVVLRAVEGGGGVTFEVQDDGAGMGEEALAQLGTPLVTGREGGHGLGVALAAGVARQHGGTLDFKSARGQGTIARMSLPRHPGDGSGGGR